MRRFHAFSFSPATVRRLEREFSFNPTPLTLSLLRHPFQSLFIFQSLFTFPSCSPVFRHLCFISIPTVFQATGALKILIISPHSCVIPHNGCYTWFQTIPFGFTGFYLGQSHQIFVPLTPYTPAAWLCHCLSYAWCLSVSLGLFPAPVTPLSPFTAKDSPSVCQEFPCWCPYHP